MLRGDRTAGRVTGRVQPVAGEAVSCIPDLCDRPEGPCHRRGLSEYVALSSVAAVTILVRRRVQPAGSRRYGIGALLVRLGSGRITGLRLEGLRWNRASLRRRGIREWLGDGAERTCLERLLLQRSQVLLLSFLLVLVADESDDSTDDRDEREHHDDDRQSSF